jgi:hypothetical protein
MEIFRGDCFIDNAPAEILDALSSLLSTNTPRLCSCPFSAISLLLGLLLAGVVVSGAL